MFNFSGCKCPICQQAFTETDDIVVCPECGAPYHRNCYMMNGGCVFSDRHSANFEWKPAPGESVPVSEGGAESGQPAGKEIPCPNCGAMNPEDDLFCETCGAPLRRSAPGYGPDAKGGAAYGPGSGAGPDPFQIAGLPPELQVHPEDEMDGIKARDWAAYLGENAGWYLFHFKRICDTGHKFALSFSAFLFGPFFFLYRKMWGPAIALIITNLVLLIPSILEMSIMVENPLIPISSSTLSILIAVSSTLSLLVKMLCGAFGVYLYKRNAARKIHKLTEHGEVNSALLSKAGGTSKIALLVSIVGYVIFSYLLTYLILGPSLSSMMGGIAL